MIYQLALYLKQYYSLFNVFHYVSVRALASMLSTLLFSCIAGGWFIAKSKKVFRSRAREWTPENHRQKDNMPTMGGIFILLAVILNVLIWCNLTDAKVWVFLLCLLSFGLIGAWDDWGKIRYNKGLSSAAKFFLQITAAFLVVISWLYFTNVSLAVSFPFFKSLHPNIGWFFVPWAMFVLIAMSNAVNLTDGLDGLAIGSLLSNFATFSLIAYIAGHFALAHYLHIPFAGSCEVAIVGSILFGASLGFLWFNSYPAQIFMGDVGSLALGAGLGMLALMAKQELLLPIAGGLFVFETVSVILQVLSFKYLGKRLFKMAPIHHHFELLGWPESKITVRFGIISFVLCLLALITLKLR